MFDPRTGVGILLCVIGIAASFWLFWSSIRLIPSTAPNAWPWLGLILLAVQIGIPTYMLIAKPAEQSQAIPATKAEEIDAAVSKAAGNPKETDKNATVLLDCQIYLQPIRTQPFADVLFMTMIDPFEGGGGPIGVASGKADKDGLFVLDPNRTKSFNYRCELTNFESYPIFSVYMNFKIQSEKTIKTEGGSKSGEIVSTRDWPVGFNYINPHSTIAFYVLGFNQKLYVIAWLPQYAQYLHGGEDTKLITKLRPAFAP